MAKKKYKKISLCLSDSIIDSLERLSDKKQLSKSATARMILNSAIPVYVDEWGL